MVLDTSAVCAILFLEPEGEAFADTVARSGTRIMSSANALEAAIVVLARKGELGLRDLDLFLHDAAIGIVSLDEAQYRLAREAYERFGRGRHAAALNFGDCCAYALSRHSGEGLLFKGDDFAKTDVLRA
jgi:ribonuclease VapC